MKSLFGIIKNLPEPLKKSSQYLKLPADMFNWVDDGKRIPKARRERYHTVLVEGGKKIRPEDYDRLVENGHPDIINPLALRDVQKDEALKLLGVKPFKNPKTYTRREEVKGLLRRVINTYVSFGEDAINEVFSSGTASAIKRIMRNNPGNVTNAALQTVAARPEAAQLIGPILENSAFDHNVGRILAAHPDSEVAAEGIKKVILDDPENSSAFTTLALQHPNPQVTSKVMSHSKVKLQDEHLDSMLRHSDTDIQRKAMGRIATNEQRDYVLNNFFNDPDTFHSNMRTFINQDNSPWKKKWSYQPDPPPNGPQLFTSDTMHKVIDKILEHDKPDVISDEFWNRTNGRQTEAITEDNHFTKDHLLKLASARFQDPSPRENYDLKRYDKGAQRLFEGVLNHEHTDSDVLSALVSNDSFKKHMNRDRWGDEDKNMWVKQIITHQNSSPELLRTVWQAAEKDESTKERDHKQRWNQHSNIYKMFATNKNTPQDVIHDIMDNYRHLASDSTMARIAQHPNLDPTRIETFMADEDPNVRLMAANNPAATADQIARGLKDKRKEVRSAWMENPSISDDHLRPLLKDRAQGNRIALAYHEKMSGDLLHEMITKDKSFKVREQAMKHDNIKPETLEWMMMNDPHPGLRDKALRHSKATEESIMRAFREKPNASIIASMLNRPTSAYSPEQYAEMTNVVTTQIADAKQKANQLEQTDPEGFKKFVLGVQRSSNRSSPATEPEALGREYGSLDRLYHGLARRDRDTAKKIIHDPNVRTTTIAKVIDFDHDQAARDGENFIGSEDLKRIYENRVATSPRVLDSVMRSIMEHHAFPQSGIGERIVNDSNPTAMASTVKNFDRLELPQQHTIIDRLQDDDRTNLIALFKKANSKELFDKLMQKPLAGEDSEVMSAVAENENADETILDRVFNKAVEHGNSRLAYQVIQNPSVGSTTVRKALNHSERSVSNMAQQKIAYIDPDGMNTALEYSDLHEGFGHEREVESHPAIEKLKHLKGLVQEAGGAIHKKELQGMGYGGAPGQILNHKGEVTPEGIDKYLNTLPKFKMNISWDFWGGDRDNTAHRSSYNGLQRHDESKTQRVLQVNFTNDQINKMKEEGVFHLFQKVHDRAFVGSHPVRKHSMGWARVDDHKPGHWHIDEVQSEIWSELMGQAYTAKQRMEGLDETHPTTVEQKDKLGKLKKIAKILQGPFKNPNHAIIGAAHDMARKLGVTSTSMDMPEDQFAQSGKRGNVNSAKFKFTYQQWPADNKYEEKPKKEVMPETQGLEPKVQFRKLIKSLNKIKYLLNQLEDDAS